MKLWIFSVLIALNFACVAKVKVDIYYESLCPDSIRFISEQLKPLYNDFSKHLDITFVPFGKSNSYIDGSKIEFTCQHGVDECFGNKVQGCVLSRIPDQDTQMSYVACQMTSGADRTHQTCVEAFGFNWSEILECAESDIATNQQLEFEKYTAPVLAETNWVPSVVYNGKISAYTHTGNAPALKVVLCELIYNTNPACAVSKRRR